jgi:transcription termination factor Rho
MVPTSNSLNIGDLDTMTLAELRTLARDLEVVGYSRLKKEELILRILRFKAEQQGHELRGGVLEIIEDGIGFLRSKAYRPSSDDIYVSQTQIRRFNLRTGDMVIGQIRPPKDSEKYYGLLRVEAVNGMDPETIKRRPNFEDLTPIFPEQRFNLETSPHILATRLLNLISPIGMGQRGLFVSPPKAGKTTVLKEVANAISLNYPGVHLMVVLIGERPEEVTDMDRSVDAEVISSTFDDLAQSHVRVAEMALERAKRLVESKKDVVIMLDSVTRLARAYNLVVPQSGRTLTGGIDPSALYPPKRFFGAARNIEEGGSLTIVATCLVRTGSRMDDVIYEEFKGTGNMELHLSRELQERRIFPAFDVKQSSTRKEELLLGPDVTQRIWTMRRMFDMMVKNNGDNIVEPTERILHQLRRTENNEEFLEALVART